MGQLEGDGLLSSVAESKVADLDEVVGIVEGKAGRLEQSSSIGSIPGLDETGTLLSDGGEELVELGTVVEELRVGIGGQDSLNHLGVEAAANLANEGVDTGGERAGHGSSGEGGITTEGEGVSGQDVTTRGTKLRLDVHLPGRAPRGEAAKGTASDLVGGNGNLLDGLAGADKAEDNLLAGLEVLDPGVTDSVLDHAGRLDRGDLGDINGDGTALVVVDHEVLGSLGSGVDGLLLKRAATTADEGNTTAQVGNIITVGLATIIGDGVVQVGSNERQLKTVKGLGLGGNIAELLGAAAIDRVVGEREDGGGLGVVIRSNSSDLLAVGGSAGIEETEITLVTGRNGARNAGLDDTGDGSSPGLLSPARRTTNGGGDDVGTSLISGVEGSNENIVSDGTLAAKDLVGTESDIGSGTSEAVLVLLGSNDTSNVGSVAAAVHGIGIGHGGVGAAVSVADEITAEGDKAALAEATTESGVLVVDTTVNDSNLDALAGDALGAQLVDLGHDVGGEGIGLGVLDGTRGQLGGRDGLLVVGDPLNSGVGTLDELNRPDVLDDGQGSQSHGALLGLLDVIELDRDALEELVVELLASLALGVDRVEEVARVMALLELEDVGTGDDGLGSVELGGGNAARDGREQRHQERGTNHDVRERVVERMNKPTNKDNKKSEWMNE